MWLCDFCGASLVRAGLVDGLAYVWGPNNIPWKEDACENCGKVENISDHLYAKPEYFEKIKG